VEDVVALASSGRGIRDLIEHATLPPVVENDIREAYAEMEAQVQGELTVAVRSSATAEDLPDASFAGQQETFLNVRGIDAVIESVKLVFASLYNDRAIAYRVHQGFAHDDVAISVGIQQMVQAGSGSSGVMFTLDTESGFEDVIFLTSSYGLGELLVQGAVEPDEFYVAKVPLRNGQHAIVRRSVGTKHQRMVFDQAGGVGVEDVSTEESAEFSLSDADVTALAAQALIIENHYGRPMDIEWAKDGVNGDLYILQARPETVRSRASGRTLERFLVPSSEPPLVTGRSVGQRVGVGPVRIVRDPSEMHQVQQGDVLVADMTDPDWEPVMNRAAAIVTNRGGRTCHAAIIARELGIPAVVGSQDATSVLVEGDVVTVSCAEGDTGFVYDGALEFEIQRVELDSMPTVPVKVMMNVANPDRAFAFSRLPNDGVGLARLEFIINNVIGVHPLALLGLSDLPADLREEISPRIAGYGNPRTFFVEKLKEGIATIAAAFYPKPVIVRLSDFKSNEYAHLLGGSLFEPTEENPMIGFRGASRYVAPEFAEAFALECEALRSVRDDMGFTNVQIMVPFVRTVAQAESVIEVLSANGIKRGANDLKLIMMCEIPSNAIQADSFLELFDGFSIGSNDLTQFTLALDRDSALIADLFDERDPSVKALISMAIRSCSSNSKYIGICGQGPSDHIDFAVWLAEEGIDSISLNPDTVLETWLALAAT
ncbi:MAG: phosphoenolpyruvate synthase, partial [Acidimicrobiia bacterium]